jgi:hypothetical protein
MQIILGDNFFQNGEILPDLVTLIAAERVWHKRNVEICLLAYFAPSDQGCQMAYFQPKSSDLGKFWRALQWTMGVYFMASWSILLPFGIHCIHLVYFMVTYLVYFSSFAMLYQEKSGNPASDSCAAFVWRPLN